MLAITKRKLSDRITLIYCTLQVLKINDFYKPETAKFMNQFSDKSLPASFEKYFTRTTVVHRYSTRTFERNNYFLPHFSTSRLTLDKILWSKNMEFDLLQFKNLSLKKFISEYKLHLIKQYN